MALPGSANDHKAIVVEEPTYLPAPTAVAKPTDTPEPTPSPTAMPEPTPSPTVTPEPTPVPTPTPEPPFTLAWASDTQIMIAHYRDMLPGFNAMCQWIADHAEDQRIVAFLHTGDMVDNCKNRGQWASFSSGMEIIAPKMPLFMTLGNHDFYDGTIWPYWTEQFFFKDIPANRRFRSGQAAYLELTAGSTDLLLIHLCFREQTNRTAIKWLKDVCDAHADVPVIFVVHAYLTRRGELMNRAQVIERELVSKCPNIRLILCGHSRGIARKTFTYDDDGDGVPERTVHALMHDLQLDRTRYGYINLLTYDPVTNSLSVDAYSPFLDDYICYDQDPDAERFTIENVF